MALKLANNARTTLASSITDSDLTFTVADGSKFPSFGVGDYSYITFADSTETTHEIVKVTARSTNTFTIDGSGRGLDGTSATAWDAGTKVELRIPKITAQEIITAGDSVATDAAAAAASASAAATSASDAAASYDSFDDRYLGAKASDPTLDNDGNALIDGALYFDTTANMMKVYDLGNTSWLRTTPTTAEQTAINTVSTSIANVNTVAGNTTNINTVASNDSNITTVAGISANVTTVAGISANVSTVATNVADVNNFADRYQISASDPTTRADTSALQDGDLYWNSTTDTMRVYDGATWSDTTDVNAALYTDVTANFTGTLQNGGSNVVVDSDIGTTVQAYDADTAKTDVAQSWTAAQTLDNSTLKIKGSSTGVTTFTSANAGGSNYTTTIPAEDMTLGFRNVPQHSTVSGTLTTAMIGKHLAITGAATIPNSTFAAGDAITLYNNTASDITITCSTTSAYIAGTNSNKASVTLATRGLTTILFISATHCVITGNVS